MLQKQLTNFALKKAPGPLQWSAHLLTLHPLHFPSLKNSSKLGESHPVASDRTDARCRMYAQGLTVAVLLASAGLAAVPTAAGPDPEGAERCASPSCFGEGLTLAVGRDEKVVFSSSRPSKSNASLIDLLYKWKKGSPHDKSLPQHQV
jgi:hypothetical protein